MNLVLIFGSGAVGKMTVGQELMKITGTYDGVVASNNLSDIGIYIKRVGLKHTTTGDILIEALEKGFIKEDEGNALWASMLAKRRKLGATSFSEYIKLKEHV